MFTVWLSMGSILVGGGMKSKVVALPVAKPVEHFCPKCGYIVSHIAYATIRFVPTCRCGTSWAKFITVSEVKGVKSV